MDKASFTGLLVGITVIFTAIAASGEGAQFLYLPAVLIVFGGTFSATLIKFSFWQVINSVKLASLAFTTQKEEPRELIEQTKELTAVARKHGILALEDVDIRNPFFRKAIDLLVDGVDLQLIQKILREEQELSTQRHEVGQRIFRSIGEQAPAFGMIGTLVGLVQMLGNLEDPEAIGPGMAVALLTTLYGAVFAQLIAIPIADNLEMRAQNEYVNQSLIIEAVDCIHNRYNSRLVDELLSNYLPRNHRGLDVPGQGAEGNQAFDPNQGGR
ncbi:MotA/TolQ/ExbB proton channel family protein [Halorhodospira halochloris]|uniref:Flagellar motor rotation protein MotA n=1 Tax=Halorhodospira halochloris TaxID=1052 RepID=A0A0X8XA45_HALHR|nr:MotA/TolQ/ExbB proton channel family protein [Halorhodospira halochloris]MBK1651999.1 flagellar motor protein PomA [Halorhodospira halochloris]MCG5530883.1 MotA/TolQ/ExbB proton channel family protein [Halorhodospira halochloris]MCG5547903.1 MotA/TolQ/ExbB proton channel family protein [Halorhodospira halochloris]BAU58296.1 flagellar motor rotation protein MotA [Halorhodospira halochloris]